MRVRSSTCFKRTLQDYGYKQRYDTILEVDETKLPADEHVCKIISPSKSNVENKFLTQVKTGRRPRVYTYPPLEADNFRTADKGKLSRSKSFSKGTSSSEGKLIKNTDHTSTKLSSIQSPETMRIRKRVQFSQLAKEHMEKGMTDKVDKGYISTVSFLSGERSNTELPFLNHSKSQDRLEQTQIGQDETKEEKVTLTKSEENPVCNDFDKSGHKTNSKATVAITSLQLENGSKLDPTQPTKQESNNLPMEKKKILRKTQKYSLPNLPHSYEPTSKSNSIRRFSSVENPITNLQFAIPVRTRSEKLLRSKKAFIPTRGKWHMQSVESKASKPEHLTELNWNDIADRKSLRAKTQIEQQIETFEKEVDESFRKVSNDLTTKQLSLQELLEQVKNCRYLRTHINPDHCTCNQCEKLTKS